MRQHPPPPEASCPACAAELAPWMAVRAGEPSDAALHDLLRCTRCGTATTVTAPSPAAYATGVYAAEPPRLARPLRALTRAARGQAARLLAAAGLRPGGRVVDAGSGSGLLVEILRDRGVDAYGIEPAARSLARAEAAGLPVLGTSIEEHDARDLDAAVLWHVLEHVAEPAAALERVGAWLRPGGLALVAVPNIESLQARIARGEWFHLDVPRHRTHFSPAGLRTLLERHGLEVCAERHLVAEHNLHGMWFALLTRLGMAPGFPFHLLKRNVPARPRDLLLVALAGPVLVLPALVLEAAAALTRRGGTIAVVAQRRA